MIGSLPLWATVLVVFVSLTLGVALCGMGVWMLYGPSFESSADRSQRESRNSSDGKVDPFVADGGTPLPKDIGNRDVRLEPPRIESVRVSLLTEIYRWMVWKWNRKRLVQDGYVQWFLIDGTWPTPRFVKPKRSGSGIPYVDVDGERYLFPEKALVPDEQQGAWTVVHRKGNSEPINPNDGDELAIPADALKDYASREVLKGDAGGLGWLNAKTLIYAGMGATILMVVAAYLLMQGGML